MKRTAPTPDLRIIPADHIHPHEEHDPQRSGPLIERIRQAEFLTNPPIVAPMEDDHYVILDGSNRYHTLCHLGYQHLLAQVVYYDSDFVELSVWQHIVSNWHDVLFIEALQQIPDIELRRGWSEEAIAEVMLKDGVVLSLHAPVSTVMERNRILRQVVDIYKKNATLHRTALADPGQVWSLYPQAIALVMFPEYHPHDIVMAAQHRAYLPPGISRHIIHGRALMLNYPLSNLRDEHTSIEEKNVRLQEWTREKLATRSIRYYAESTYQFNE